MRCENNVPANHEGLRDLVGEETLRGMRTGDGAGLSESQYRLLFDRAERAMQRLRRIYAMFSEINRLSVRVRNRAELFDAACRIAVEEGHFHLCVIATVQRGTRTLVPAAAASPSERLLANVDRIVSSLDDGLVALTEQALGKKRTVICNEWQSGHGWPEAETRDMVQSVALLPLIVSNEPIGVVVLGSGEAGYFQGDELKLLTELAKDVSFAVDYLDKAEQLHYLRFYDGVTGLANRSLFLDRAAQRIQAAADEGRQLALYLFDLERFNHVNDSLGRPAGDALLKQVATWLTRRCGNASLLARVGVDHFAVLLPCVLGEAAAMETVEKELDAFVQQPFRLEDSIFRIAAKAGIAVFPDDGTEAETLFRHAEAALKQAKASGDRCLRYRRQMTEILVGRLSLETRLRQALERREFRLHYQPKINLQSGQLTGAEALIRWQDPRSGLVPPARFMPILEETGLIHEVGCWALRQAVADGMRWRSAGLPTVRVAVNVSPLQLRHAGFIAEVWRTIATDPQSPASLELEITESVIMDGIQKNIAVLQAIREMGVQVAIDDFGTGFSSLSYLSRLPVDTLKIDRSFVVEMTTGPQGLSLVSTIINLAHSLKLKVVAEGVETDEQSRLLRLLNCDEIQGFLVSKAVTDDEFEARFLRG